MTQRLNQKEGMGLKLLLISKYSKKTRLPGTASPATRARASTARHIAPEEKMVKSYKYFFKLLCQY